MGRATATVYKPTGKGPQAPLPDVGTLYIITADFPNGDCDVECACMILRHLENRTVKMGVISPGYIDCFPFKVGNNGAIGPLEGMKMTAIRYANREDYLARIRVAGINLKQRVRAMKENDNGN